MLKSQTLKNLHLSLKTKLEKPRGVSPHLYHLQLVVNLSPSTKLYKDEPPLCRIANSSSEISIGHNHLVNLHSQNHQKDCIALTILSPYKALQVGFRIWEFSPMPKDWALIIPCLNIYDNFHKWSLQTEVWNCRTSMLQVVLLLIVKKPDKKMCPLCSSSLDKVIFHQDRVCMFGFEF